VSASERGSCSMAVGASGVEFTSGVVALERAHEGLGHDVRLRAADGRGPRPQADLTCEAPGCADDAGTAVLARPFYRFGQADDGSPAALDAVDLRRSPFAFARINQPDPRPLAADPISG
jgi:hypothetical protein